MTSAFVFFAAGAISSVLAILFYFYSTTNAVVLRTLGTLAAFFSALSFVFSGMVFSKRLDHVIIYNSKAVTPIVSGTAYVTVGNSTTIDGKTFAWVKKADEQNPKKLFAVAFDQPPPPKFTDIDNKIVEIK